MQPPPSPRLAAQRWLERAERDLAAARLTLGAAPPLLEMAAYHAQQAAEKALKGFLVRHGQAAPKVHDLVPLLAACQALEARFGAFLAAAQALTPYATRFRYPDVGGPLEPPRAEAEQAVRLAERIVGFVQQRL
jgi:HEPN domain-containing protein